MNTLNLKITVFAGMSLLLFSSVFGQIKFEDVTEKAGLIEPLKGMAGHCAVWGDANSDGFPDLFFGTFTHFPDSVYNERGHTTGKEPNKFFINNGDGTFKEIKECPVGVKGKNSGGAFADLDNDGDLDLVLSHQSHLEKWVGDMLEAGIDRNMLFENDGKGNFTNVTFQSGIDFWYPFLGRSTFIFDFDGDGLLDIFMQEDWVLSDISGGNSRLMKNMGGLKFKDVTKEAGFPTGFHQGLYGLGGFVGDINGDGWPDVFFAHSCRMFINNTDGTFREKKYHFVDEQYTAPSTVNLNWTCGADIGDLDNDGHMDLVMGGHFGPKMEHRLYVFLNEGNDENGDPVLRDITAEANVANPDGRTIHVQIQDIDNDGKMDILTSNCASFVYRNNGLVDGAPTFGAPVNSGFDCGIKYWAGGALVDYDRDGRLDFFGPEWRSSVPSPLLRNVTEGAENYIDVCLALKNHSNRNGIGAKVEIFRQGLLGDKEGLLGTYIISVTNGYSSGYEAVAHFGLPNDKKVDVQVTMPCTKEVFTAKSVKRNQRLTIKR
jgi:hypothetical protein